MLKGVNACDQSRKWLACKTKAEQAEVLLLQPARTPTARLSATQQVLGEVTAKPKNGERFRHLLPFRAKFSAVASSLVQ